MSGSNRLEAGKGQEGESQNVFRTSFVYGPFAAEPLEIHVVRDDDDAVLGPPHVHLEHLCPAILDGVPEGRDKIILNTTHGLS